MGFCTDAEYDEFMRQAPEFEPPPGAQRRARLQILVLGSAAPSSGGASRNAGRTRSSSGS